LRRKKRGLTARALLPEKWNTAVQTKLGLHSTDELANKDQREGRRRAHQRGQKRNRKTFHRPTTRAGGKTHKKEIPAGWAQKRGDRTLSE